MSSEGDKSHVGVSPFQEHLALGLHAFAQPLAILRAKLYAESIARMGSEDLAQLAYDSAAHVERLCTLFNYLQEIVLAEGSETSPDFVAVSEIVEHVADGLELWFKDTGLTLALDLAAPAPNVFADKNKLSQALLSLVVLAHGQSRLGDTVSINWRSAPEHTEIVVSNSDAEVPSLNSEGRLALALVETNLRRQGGSFAFSLQPLSLIAGVPNAPISS